MDTESGKPVESGQGHHAQKPTEITRQGWWAILKRVKQQTDDDQIPIVSAGIAFYFFLAIFPLLAAVVSIYGLVVTPESAEQQISQMAGSLPEEAHDAISEIARNAASNSDSTLGWATALSILVSIWSANKGTKALVTGLNIAYDEDENRGFIRKIVITLGLTLGAFVAGILMLVLVAGIPAISGMLNLPETMMTVIGYARWLVIALIITVVLGLLYKWAPDRDPANWKWVSPGSIVAAVLWLVGSGLFSLYVENFGKMSQSYGSFATVVTLMLWLFLTAFIILLGAEINSEAEHQTAHDTTEGPDERMGARGAYHADHVADGSEQDDTSSPG